MQLVLSLFSGIGLLDRAFKEAGFCVVSAGDLILGQDIRDFTGVKNKFDGIIAGSPCQDFSLANRDRPVLENSYGLDMTKEFIRIVTECEPMWALLENVPQIPNVTIPGYNHQRIDINQAWFEDIYRLRHIQFFHKSSVTLQIERKVIDRSRKLESCALASDHRSFKDLVRLQGLEDDFDLPSFNVAGKKRAVGNGVPLSIGRVLAKEVLSVTQQQTFSKTPQGKCDILNVTERQKKVSYKLHTDDCRIFRDRERFCQCGCKRVVTGRKIYYDASCRKRAQRLRDRE
jgi:DNA (cytosine-5)-methyltransferase 1